MIFAYILSWISTMVLLICATLCIASGLFYLAEIVEEYPQPTKQFISIAMVVACILNACMWVFEGLPLFTVVLPGLVAHAVYSLHLPPFPVCNFTSVAFVGSISLARCVRFGRHIPRSIILIRHCSYLVMFVIHQYCVFAHFSTHYYVFGDVLAYFTVCVWLVPFIFFVSLTSGDSNLPTTSSNGIGTENYAGDNITAPRRNNKMGLKTILTWFQRKEGLPSVIENTPHGHDVGMGDMHSQRSFSSNPVYAQTHGQGSMFGGSRSTSPYEAHNSSNPYQRSPSPYQPVQSFSISHEFSKND